MTVPNDPNEPVPPPPPPGGYGAPPPPAYGTPQQPGYGTPSQPGGYPPPAPESYGTAPPAQPGYGYQPMPGAPGYPTPQAGAERAGFGRRLGAVIIDGIIVGIITSILAAIFSIDVTPGVNPAYNLLNIVLTVAYWGGLESFLQGQTLGKKALGIAVRDINTGEIVPPARALIRAVGRVVSGAVCALGYLWMLWDGQKQTWHDKFANTTVVKL